MCSGKLLDSLGIDTRPASRLSAPDKIKLSWEPIPRVTEYQVQVFLGTDQTSAVDTKKGIDGSQNAYIVGDADGPDTLTCYKLTAFRDRLQG